ncbi:DUF2279 domain-containing protein [Flavihumibacter stibioxidans]|uniref:DUF2279 domain-containing protein n=1 Tax=Flavihumibacter stibioxidans TaxID=1834163 RepID=UPI0016502FF3|nr:DUF2279 domain-containing protein [Flavihumibacter stibioxidans]
MRLLIFAGWVFAGIGPARGQDSISLKTGDLMIQVDSVKGRPWLVAGAHAAAWAGTFIALNKAWYEGYDKAEFHSFNDGREWNQMDKAGHIWTTYQLGRASGATWKWAGLPRKSAIWLGGASAVAFQSIIEIQDGYSVKWGFSWWDMAANITGAGAYVAQELGWKEQRIQIKMGYWPHRYPAEFLQRRNELFGAGNLERILKDYNSQAYWLSVNLYSFFPESRLPEWLNISLGYSSDLMLGGMENRWTNGDGQVIDRSDIKRVRKYYLSADLDLTRIPTRSKFLRSVFFAINAIKIPAPAIEFNSSGKFRLHALHH